MKLTIRRAGEPHFGKYTCVAKNPRGQTDGSITLYGGCLTSLSIQRIYFLMHQNSTIHAHWQQCAYSKLFIPLSQSLFLHPFCISPSCLDFGVVFVARAPPTTTTPLTTPTTTSTTLLTYKVHLQEKQQGKNIKLLCTSLVSYYF